MSAHVSGGPAFPSHGTMGEVAQGGMSLRDYFAAQALPQLVESHDDVDPTWLKRQMEASGVSGAYELIAKRAYEMADAMIAERAKS